MNNPLFAGNPQLQEQMRHQLPVFLQQVGPAHMYRFYCGCFFGVNVTSSVTVMHFECTVGNIH